MEVTQGRSLRVHSAATAWVDVFGDGRRALPLKCVRRAWEAASQMDLISPP